MLQVLSLKRLLEAIAPELTERLRAAEQAAGEVSLHVEKETAGWMWNGEQIIVTNGKGDGILLGQDEMMKMVLGLVPVEQVLKDVSGNVAMLRAAFPTQGTATGIWG